MFPKLCLLDTAETQAVSNGDSTTGIVVLVSRVLDDKPDFDSFATTSSSGLQAKFSIAWVAHSLVMVAGTAKIWQNEYDC
jgi:hypothetical protein